MVLAASAGDIRCRTRDQARHAVCPEDWKTELGRGLRESCTEDVHCAKADKAQYGKDPLSVSVPPSLPPSLPLSISPLPL